MASAPPPPPGRIPPWAPWVVLLAATVAAYLPALGCGWIWDDEPHVTQNPLLRTPGGLAAIWTAPRLLPQWYPVTHTTFWLEYGLWDLRPLGYHLVNVLLHAANALLLWRLLRSLELRGAWLAAMLFALHPVEVESVAWVTERKNVLSGLLYLLALRSWLRYAGIAAGGGRAGLRGDWIAAFAFFVLALLSKSVTATLPAVALVIAWWKRGRIERRDALPLLPFFAVGIASGLLTVWLERRHVGAEGADFEMSVAERLLVAGRPPWFYAWKLALPLDLCFIYPRWTLDAAAAWQWLFPAATLGLLGGLWAARGRVGRGPLAAVLVFGGTLFPALGFLNVYPFRYSFVADHFQYLASAALLALLGEGAARALAAAGPALRGAALGGAGALLASLGVLTAAQCRMYEGVETLWTRTIALNPGAFIAWNNLGHEAFSRGVRARDRGVPEEARRRFEEAERLFRRAVELQPRNYEAVRNIACCRLEAGDLVEAERWARRSLDVRPGYGPAWDVIGRVRVHAKDLPGAVEAFRRAAEPSERYPDGRWNLMVALDQSGRYAEALEVGLAAVEAYPWDERFAVQCDRLRRRLGR